MDSNHRPWALWSGNQSSMIRFPNEWGQVTTHKFTWCAARTLLAFSAILHKGEMMKYLTLTIAAGIAMAGLYINTAFANSYPIYPPGTSVSLDPSNFISYIAQATPGLPDVDLLVGDNLAKHPYTFGSWTSQDRYVIGVLGCQIDTSFPGAVYLWLTSGGMYEGGGGVRISLGDWENGSFIQESDFVNASFYYAGVDVLVVEDSRGNAPFLYHLNSSITRLSEFQFTGSQYANAIMLEKYGAYPDHVETVAVSNVPEPASLLLLGTGLGVIGLAAWRRKK